MQVQFQAMGYRNDDDESEISVVGLGDNQTTHYTSEGSYTVEFDPNADREDVLENPVFDIEDTDETEDDQ